MNITTLKTNRMTTPLGFELDTPRLSYTVTDTAAARQDSARIIVSLNEDGTDVVYDSGRSTAINSLAFEPAIVPEPSTRYYWNVHVWADNGEEGQSETTWFETPKDTDWTGKWITPSFDKTVMATVYRTVKITKAVRKARLYVLGLGLYELYVNGVKANDEYLLPGIHDYDSWMQYQTYEADLLLGDNLVEIMLGDGWYKGVFGLGFEAENYGERLACIAELAIWYEDGQKEVIGTDTSWHARKNKIVSSGIYDGEVYDATMDVTESVGTELIALGTERLKPRLSPPIIINDRITPIARISTPAGETVLDMGQNMVGWLSFRCRQKHRTKLCFQFGEILQEGNFYRDNLRKAKAEFTYIADGTDAYVRPHFTFYGFRYVKITGWEGGIDLNDFSGLVIHSQMDRLGHIETSDPLVNRLFSNALWGQKGNFLDLPTDCPQRDERMGWTGDAQIFCGTASYNMDTYAFYTKYGYDVYCEQQKLDGSVPYVVPTVNFKGDGSTAWGEAATIIPWTVYLHYGDAAILKTQYQSMKAWVDYMKRADDADGGKRLWLTGFHFADWLALDGRTKGGVFGGTDPHYIASAYYYYSTSIVAKTAKIIGRFEDYTFYDGLAKEIKAAFGREYFTPEGRLSIDTMTAYVVALYMELTPDNALERTITGLKNKLKSNGYHLSTGFVGTPYLCRVLSDHGLGGLSYRLLMEKGFPGWLYQVLMGATTIWERWDSVLPDGRISSTGMNSLNHYSYGSIVEWMYRNMLGLKPVEDAPGFKSAIIAPQPDHVLSFAKGTVSTASGLYQIGWTLKGQQISIDITVPFDADALIILPDADYHSVHTNTALPMVQDGRNVKVAVTSGTYNFAYEATCPYCKIYSTQSTIAELLANEKIAAVLETIFPDVNNLGTFQEESVTLEELITTPFMRMSRQEAAKLDEMLREASLLSE